MQTSVMFLRTAASTDSDEGPANPPESGDAGRTAPTRPDRWCAAAEPTPDIPGGPQGVLPLFEWVTEADAPSLAPNPGLGPVYFAKARRYAYCGWDWEVLCGPIGREHNDRVTASVPVVVGVDDSDRRWQMFGGRRIWAVQVGSGSTDTLAEARAACQDAADEHHWGEDMAWWAYAKRAAANAGERP